MSAVDVSILIVHTFERNLLRQTLRNLRRSAPQVRYEVVIADNNPALGMQDLLRREFPEVRYIATEKNRGFGAAMNCAMTIAQGSYVLVFNPDIVILPGALESLHTFLQEHPDVGAVGPQLLNADGTLQPSCNRFHEPMIPVYRRTPLGKTRQGKEAIARFLMEDVAHDQTMDVDWIMGSAMFARAEVLRSLAGFDEGFFMYFEDTDLCRRLWQAGWRVVYYPKARMVHYHRRASADGSLISQLFSSLTHAHVRSAWRFFSKYRGQLNPRHVYFERQQHSVVEPTGFTPRTEPVDVSRGS